MILVVPFDIAIGGLQLDRAYGACLKGLSFAEYLFGIGVGLGLVISGKIQIDIRLLIALESKEGLKGDIESVFYKRLSAYGTDLIRHVTAGLVGIIPYGLTVEVGIMTFSAVIM